MCVNDAIALARNKAQVLAEESEFWKKDHALAVLYYDFEELLESGIAIFDSVTKIDEDWRRQVLCHEVEYNQDVARGIADVYALLGKAYEAISSQLLPAFESQFGTVVNAPEFRSRYREVRGILTSDGDFFVGDSLIGLRDAAIDENRRGEAVDVDGAR